MNKFLTLSELELRARLRKDIDIAVEIVKDPPEIDPSIQLAYEEKKVFEAVRLQRELDAPLHPLKVLESEIPKLGADPSGLRHHSFEDFVSSPAYRKNARKIMQKKEKRTRQNIVIGERGVFAPIIKINPYKNEDDILLDGLVEKINE